MRVSLVTATVAKVDKLWMKAGFHPFTAGNDWHSFVQVLKFGPVRANLTPEKHDFQTLLKEKSGSE